MNAPDPNWMPFAQLLVFLVTVIMLFTLAESIALGKVDAESSYGLKEIITALEMLASGMAGWFAAKNMDGK